MFGETMLSGKQEALILPICSVVCLSNGAVEDASDGIDLREEPPLL
jgi:hypothetical protein